METYLFKGHGVHSAAWIGLALTLAIHSTAWGARLPDEEKSQLSEDSVSAIATSSDGRVVATFGGGVVRFFDAFTSKTYASDDKNKVTLSDCSSAVGLHIYGSTTYYVHVLCSSGKISQFSLGESEDTSSALTLEASTDVTDVELAGLSGITASVLDGSTIYFAGSYTGESTISQTMVYSLTASNLGEDPVEFTNFTNQTTVAALGVRSSSLLVAANSNGDIFLLSASVPASSSLTTCGTAPSEMLLLSTSLALLLGDDNYMYMIVLGDSVAESCEPMDWGFSSVPASMAMVERDGAGNGLTTDYLYVRVSTQEGNEIGVYRVPSSVTEMSPDTSYRIETEKTASSNDVIAASDLARVYLGTPQGLFVISSGPWLTAETSADEPITVTETSPEIELSISSDEDVEVFRYSLDEPFDSSASSNIDETLYAGETVTMRIDTSNLLSAGLNQLFIYGQDSDDNLGWTSIRVNKIEEPAGIDDLTVKFGNEKLYISFTKPDDDAIDGYDLLIDTETFTPPTTDGVLPQEWDDKGPTITVDNAATYPGEEGWPMSLDYTTTSNSDTTDSTTDTTTTSYWTEDGTTLTYILYPLDNDQMYYISLRATSSGIPGPWSETHSGMPETTCGAVCLAGDAGGFCNYMPHARDRGRGKGFAPLGLLLMTGGWLRCRQRGNGGTSSSNGRRGVRAK